MYYCMVALEFGTPLRCLQTSSTSIVYYWLCVLASTSSTTLSNWLLSMATLFAALAGSYYYWPELSFNVQCLGYALYHVCKQQLFNNATHIALYFHYQINTFLAVLPSLFTSSWPQYHCWIVLYWGSQDSCRLLQRFNWSRARGLPTHVSHHLIAQFELYHWIQRRDYVIRPEDIVLPA
jgi:hypothetical protein